MSETAERSKKLTRQYKRYLGNENAESVIANASQNARLAEFDDAAIRDLHEILKNFPAFFETIDKSYAEYEDRINIATRNVEISSQELTATLNKVESLNLNINAMLDSLGQALLFFNSEGICSDVYSKSCISILGGCPANRPVGDVLNFTEDAKETFATWLEVVFASHSAMNFDDLKALLPNEFINPEGAYIELDYKPMHLYDQSLSGVLLIATDVTFQRAAEARFHALQLQAQEIQQIAMDRNGFYTLISDLYGFIDMVKSTRSEVIEGEDLTAIKRVLHTFKGHAGMYSLETLTDMLHDIENDIRNIYSQAMPTVDMIKYAERLEKFVDEKKKYAQSLFGTEFMSQGKIKAVDGNVIEQLTNIVDTLDCPQESKSVLEKFVYEHFLSAKIFDLFYNFKRETIRLCEMHGKEPPEIVFSGQNIPIRPEDFGEFFKMLVHLARNIADHALEAPDTRLEKGKNPAGRVEVNIRVENHTLIVSIKDDGRGINPEEIRNKLQKSTSEDLSVIPDDQIIYRIFDADFSSKQSANMISGRGMGMNAILDCVKSLDGKIEVYSDFKNSTGTEFRFIIPLPDNLSHIF